VITGPISIAGSSPLPTFREEAAWVMASKNTFRASPTVTASEAGALSAVPTEDAAAYDFYLQGLTYESRPGLVREDLLTAQELYERALARDPGFGLAHAALSRSHYNIYSLRYDQSPERLAQADREAATALHLAPRLPQARADAARGDFERHRYREALGELELAITTAPNDPDLWLLTAMVQRSLGNWDSAFAALGKARQLDPRNANLLHLLGDTYHYLRRYPEAIEAYRHESALAPDLIQPRLSLGWSYVLWKGDLDTLRAVLRGVPLAGLPGAGGRPIADQRLYLLLYDRKPDSILTLLPILFPAADTGRSNARYRASWAIQAYTLTGNRPGSRPALDSLAALLEGEERLPPDDPDLHFARGSALARLGRREEALREVAWLERSDADRWEPSSTGTGVLQARILIALGNFDSAFALLEPTLARPSLFSVSELQLVPDFDPIREDPRYTELIRKYGGTSNVQR